MTRVINLYSGSKGNATLICAGGAKVLIDAGRSARVLAAALTEAGVSPEELDAIFVTHEHVDHTAALAVFSRQYRVPVHITEPSAAILLTEPDLAACAVVHPPLYTVEIAGLRVSTFVSSHDSAACVGFRLDCADAAIGYATDSGYVTDGMRAALTGCDTVVLECNHDPDMLRTGRYPAELKRRIASRMGHLSNLDCAAFAAELAEAGMRRLMLAHLSPENNTPETAYAELCGAIGHRLCENGGDITLAIASAECQMTLIDEGTPCCS